MKILIGGKKEQKARSLAAAPTTAVPDEGGLQRALEEDLPLSCPSHRLIHVTFFSLAFAELLSCENRVGRRSDMQKSYHQKKYRIWCQRENVPREKGRMKSVETFLWRLVSVGVALSSSWWQGGR